MKIETGKHYVTRDGRKVRIYATDGDPTYPIHGAFLRDGRGWWSTSWTHGGRHLAPQHLLSDLDIVGPWIDKPVINAADMPAWCSWAAMDEVGHWFAYTQEPSQGKHHWSVTSGGMETWARIPPSHAPKWDGNWRDSLVKFR